MGGNALFFVCAAAKSLRSVLATILCTAVSFLTPHSSLKLPLAIPNKK